MKKALLFLTVIAAATIFTSSMLNQKKTLRHVVLFKFKDSSTPADVKKIEEAFKALPKKIKTITAFEWGTNISTEGVSQGLTHCFLVTFASEKDRDNYLPHPEHKAFVDLAGPHIDKVTVVDYWAE
ncbi:Dabb family protein [Pollutibacter soli]|uniref:Dabb family protein n=1 Tax=Pollutibacter soli TaxID=3034157 RepID=UPI0030141D5B